MLPAAAFRRPRLNAVSFRRDDSVRSRYLEAAFRSPTATARSSSHHAEVAVPSLPLRLPCCTLTESVRPPAPFQPFDRIDQRRQPVTQLPFSTLDASPNFNSPPGISTPSGSKRCPVIRQKTYLCKLPDFPSLPACRACFNKLACGSSFRARYFLPGSLFREPLGTSVIMLPNTGGVNRNHPRQTPYPHLFSLLFTVTYKTRLWSLCG